VKRTRSKDNWTRKESVYQGIFWKTDAIHNLSFCDIPSLLPDFFLIKKPDDIITMGYMMKVSINKNPIVVEIMFASNLTWNLFIFGSKVQPKYLGLPNNMYVLTKKSVVYVYDAVKCLRLCRGLKELPTPEKNSPDVFKEIFTECDTEDNTRDVTIHKSFKCAKVLNFNSFSDDLCAACRSVKKRQSENDHHDHSVPQTNEMPCAIEHSSTDEKLLPLHTSENFKVDNDKDDEIVNLCSEDHEDLSKIMDSLITDSVCPPRINELMIDQQRNMKQKKMGEDGAKVSFAFV
jgi:hypothetical protein